MAELISKREDASIQLLTFDLSSGEVEAIVACLNYVLTHTDDEQLEQLTGAYRDELEAIRDDMSKILESADEQTESDELLTHLV